MKKLSIVCLVVFAILFTFCIPLAVDWMIIANNVPSNISNSDWVGFLGSYIGAIVGGVVSLIGIGVTIRFTKQQIALSQEQFAEQNRLNNRPMLDFEISNILDEEDDETIIMNCKYASNNEECFGKSVVVFDVCNIGLGAALDIKYGIEVDGIIQDGMFWHWKNSSLKCGCRLKQKIRLFFPMQKAYAISLLVFYDDILGNQYIKRVKLLNQQTELGLQMLMILTQEKGEVYNAKINNRYYVISSMQPTDASKKAKADIN